MSYLKVLKNDSEVNTVTGVHNQCYHCLHYDPARATLCAAFPGGIPLIILLGMYDHSYPYEEDGVDDGGLRFMAKEAA